MLYLEEFLPLDDGVFVLVDLGEHALDLLISDLALSQVKQHLLELSCIHCPVLVLIVQLESMLQLYPQWLEGDLPVISEGVKCFLSSKLTS